MRWSYSTLVRSRLDRRIRGVADRLDPEVVERVVRRALEFDVQASDAGRAGEGIDADALVAAAGEVGISPEAVRRAIAFERLGPRPRPSPLDRFLGPESVVVQETLDLSAAMAMGRLDTWLTEGHFLRPMRVEGLSGRWQRRRDLAARIQRKLRGLTGGATLGGVEDLRAQAAPIGEGSCVARVLVVRRRSRWDSLMTLTALAGFSVACVALAVVVNPLLVFLSLLGMLAAASTARRSRLASAELRTELDRLIQQVESGETPESFTPRSRRDRRSGAARGPTTSAETPGRSRPSCTPPRRNRDTPDQAGGTSSASSSP